MGILSSRSAEQKLDFVRVSLDSCDDTEAVYNLGEPTKSRPEHR